MTVWIKQGVCGDLSQQAQKGLGKVALLYHRNNIQDLYVTSIREGNHSFGSLHYRGDAFDIRKGNMNIEAIKKELGLGWDVVLESDHIHVEYDPKEIN